MLSLRLIIFAALSGVALWGLFSLLDNLREPELLRTAKVIVVKGCEPLESEDAKRLCPQLFCQKSLLDAHAVSLRSRFEITIDRSAGDARLIGGVARQDPPSVTSGEQRFACILRNGSVAAARVIEAAQLDAFATRPAPWSFD